MLLSLIPIYLMLLPALEENVTTEFGDLGKLLLAGVLVAVALAVLFTLIRMRLRDKKPRAADFISISSSFQQDKK
jgi:hypothetical protein